MLIRLPPNKDAHKGRRHRAKSEAKTPVPFASSASSASSTSSASSASSAASAASNASSRKHFLITVLAILVIVSATVLSSCVPKAEPQLTTEEKLEDFRLMFDVLKDNHPYLALKKRVEGYDWVAHESEFESAITATKNDKEFVQTIQRILLLINNGHTSVIGPDLFNLIKNLPEELTPWHNEAAKTDEETVARWFDMVVESMAYPQNQALPFMARYNQGKYLVYWISDDFSRRYKVDPGCVISKVNDMDVHDFVANLRGETWLYYDPQYKRLYMRDFLPPYKGAPYQVTFENDKGGTVEATASFQRITKPIYPPEFPTNIWQLGSNIYTAILEEGRVAYIHIFEMTQYQSSQLEREILLSFFEEIKDVPALIIDMRNNSGGDDRFWMLNIVRPLAREPLNEFQGAAIRTGEYIKPFMEANAEAFSDVEGLTSLGMQLTQKDIPSILTPEELENLPPEILGPDFEPPVFSMTTIEPSGECPYKGKIYVLTGPGVFSSAESFCMFCKSSGWATLVGEYTGGDGGGSTPAMITLPNSKIPVFFPSTLSLNPDFTANEETHTAPDVLVEPSPENIIRYVKALTEGKKFSMPDPNYDTVLKECLRLALEETEAR